MIVVVQVPGTAAVQWWERCVAVGLSPSSADWREGVHSETNPRDGHYHFPDELAGQVALMSPTGLRRSDPAFLERALLPVGDWRCAERPDAWLRAVLLVLRDASLRGYPTWLADDEELVHAAPSSALLEWLNHHPSVRPGSIPPAAPSARPSGDADDPELDSLLHALRTRAPVSGELLERLVGRLRRPV